MTKEDALEKAIEIGKAYATSSSDGYAGDVIEDAYNMIISIAQKEGFLHTD